MYVVNACPKYVGCERVHLRGFAIAGVHALVHPQVCSLRSMVACTVHSLLGFRSWSGAVPLTDCAIHIVVAATQMFDLGLLATVVQVRPPVHASVGHTRCACVTACLPACLAATAPGFARVLLHSTRC